MVGGLDDWAITPPRHHATTSSESRRGGRVFARVWEGWREVEFEIWDCREGQRRMGVGVRH